MFSYHRNTLRHALLPNFNFQQQITFVSINDSPMSCKTKYIYFSSPQYSKTKDDMNRIWKLIISIISLPWLRGLHNFTRVFLLQHSPYRPEFGGLASEILVGALNFASKNRSYKYPKFCPLNFRYDPKIGTFFPTFASYGDRTSQVFLLNW